MEKKYKGKLLHVYKRRFGDNEYFELHAELESGRKNRRRKCSIFSTLPDTPRLKDGDRITFSGTPSPKDASLIVAKSICFA